jgi:hypothetical protein
MEYYRIEAEVAGGWGGNTVATPQAPGRPPVVHVLNYEFDGWLGDHLLESAGCFIATKQLAAEIELCGLTGVSFDSVEITKSGEFDDLYGDVALPEFVWMKVDGKPGEDDFGEVPYFHLVVSERALEVLTRAGLSHADITPFEGAPSST